MPKFRRKPIIVDAIRFVGNNALEIKNFCNTESKEVYYGIVSQIGKQRLAIETTEGFIYADDGDWIIKDNRGEFSVCRPAVFQANYVALESHHN